jgi:cytochrome c-type biogenesis protein CcmH/NrfG
MNKRNYIAVLTLAFTLCSCSTQQFKNENESEQNLFEVARLANIAYENEDYVESEKHYTILVEQIPKETEHWFRLGNVYARTEQFDSAVIAYREALVRDPELTKAWFNMSLVQLRQSMNSLLEMQLYSDKNDPLYIRSKELIDELLEVMNEDSTD